MQIKPKESVDVDAKKELCNYIRFFVPKCSELGVGPYTDVEGNKY